MAINVVVSGDSDPIELNVTGGVGPGAPDVGTNFIVAGDGITVATASGQVVISGRSTAAISGIAPVQQVQGRTGNVVIVAGDIKSGVFDVARIPVLPSENQVVSSGTIANLTSGQQSNIVKGTIVTTTDGRRWVYSGSGTKTDPASYVELADITPDWSVIANKPTTFSPSAHTHSTTDVVLFSESASAAAPVQKVAGRTGEVVLTSADVSDLTTVANVVSVNGRTGVVSLTVADISDLTAVASVVSVNGQTGFVSLTAADVSAAPSVHSHLVADVSDLTTVANVVSVNGHTGVVSLVVDDLTAAAAVHTHSRVQVSDLTASDISFSPNRVLFSNVYSTLADLPSAVDNHGMFAHVHSEGRAYYAHAGGWAPLANQSDVTVASVNGKTGVVSLVVDDITAAAAVHGHVAADVSDLTTVANVVSVNGKTGVVSLVVDDITAAAAVHGHVAADVSDLTTVANVVSVNGITGAPSIVAGDNVTVTTSESSITIAAAASSSGDSLPSQGGSDTRVLSTDGTAASWVSRFSIVDDVVVAGLGISFTKDTNAGSITFEAAGGTSGVTVGSATPQPLGVAVAGLSGNAAREDHVHAMPSASDVGAAVAVHTHGTTDIVGFTASIQEFANVKSVQGRTGDVVLTLEDVTGAAAVHTHSTTDIVGFTTVANVVSVNGITGTPSIVAGANVTVTTSASSIVVTAGGGGGDEGGGGIALSYLFS
jgi:hypothetical protein